MGEGRAKGPTLGLRSDSESGAELVPAGGTGACLQGARPERRARVPLQAQGPGQVCWCQDRDTEGLRLLGGSATEGRCFGTQELGFQEENRVRPLRAGKTGERVHEERLGPGPSKNGCKMDLHHSLLLAPTPLGSGHRAMT